MTSTVPSTLAAVLCFFSLAVNVPGAVAQEAAPVEPAATSKPEKQTTDIKIGYLRAYAPQLALSVARHSATRRRRRRRQGRASATTTPPETSSSRSSASRSARSSPTPMRLPPSTSWSPRAIAMCVADLSAKQLLSIADIARDKGVLIFNVGATDDDPARGRLPRQRLPHRADAQHAGRRAGAVSDLEAMAADGCCIYGSHDRDHLFADALRRAATRFGGEIVAEKEFKDTGTARRTDTGVVQIQQQMPVFTQDLPDHDVVLVADESEVFGTYVPFRTWTPAPGGRHRRAHALLLASGQRAMGRHRRSRTASTRRSAGACCPRTCTAWTAVRIVGEAATRTNSARSAARSSDYHPHRRFLDRRLQGPEADLPPLEPAVAPADLPRRRQVGRLHLAAGGLPAPGLRARHARRRPAGNEMRA